MASYQSRQHQHHASSQHNRQQQQQLSRVASVSSISSLSSSSAVLLFAPPSPAVPATTTTRGNRSATDAGSSPSIGSNASLPVTNGSHLGGGSRSGELGNTNNTSGTTSTVLWPSHAGDGTFSLDLSSVASSSTTSSSNAELVSNVGRLDIDTIDEDLFLLDDAATSSSVSSSSFAHVLPVQQQGYRWHKLTAAALDSLKQPANEIVTMATPHSAAPLSDEDASSNSWTGANTNSSHAEEDSYLALSAGLTIHRTGHGSLNRSRKRRAVLTDDDRSSQKRSNRSSSHTQQYHHHHHHHHYSQHEKENVVPTTPRAHITATNKDNKKDDVFLSSIVRHFVDDETMDLLRHAPGSSSDHDDHHHVGMMVWEGEATTPRATSPIIALARNAREEEERRHGLAQLLINHANAHSIETIIEEDDLFSREQSDGAIGVMMTEAGMATPLKQTSRSRSFPDFGILTPPQSDDGNEYHPSLYADDEYGSLFFPRTTTSSSSAEKKEKERRRSKTPPPPHVPGCKSSRTTTREWPSEQSKLMTALNRRSRSSYVYPYSHPLHYHYHQQHQDHRPYDYDNEEHEEGEEGKIDNVLEEQQNPWGGEFDALQVAISYWRRVLSAFKWSPPNPPPPHRHPSPTSTSIQS